MINDTSRDNFTLYDVAISVVIYHTNDKELIKIIELLNQSQLNIKIYLIDNSATDCLSYLGLLKNVCYIFNARNLGYGAAHNVAMRMAANSAKYQLIINSDIDFDPEILYKAFVLMEANKSIGMLSPMILTEDGELQHFCRKLPTPFDLFARRFIPKFASPLFKSALNGYLMLDKDYTKPMNVPNLSGCFMFTRMETLVQIGGFDENIFLYVEDVDLTRRLNEISLTLYYPEIAIHHQLAQGSYKFSKLVLYHIQSAIYYFNKWGWFFDSKRTVINNKITKESGLSIVIESETNNNQKSDDVLSTNTLNVYSLV